MASSASGGGVTGSAPQRYFCHQCNHTVVIAPSESGELFCPDCNGGFIEELNLPPPNPNPNPNPNLFFPSFDDSSFPPFLFSSSSSSSSAAAVAHPSSLDVRSPADLAGLFSGGSHTATFRSSSSSAVGPEPFNPMQFIQNYLQTMMGDGANIQFVFEGGGGGGGGGGGIGSPFAGNLGDYFIGPGLEQLIQQLAENDPNRYGTPPAAKSALNSLLDVKITQELTKVDDEAQCAVCKDEFEIGAEAKQMPCKHMYHKDCIMPWLELHNSCPVCRFELPTDDAEYESRRRGGVEGLGQGATAVAESGGSGGIGLAAAAVGSGGEDGNGTTVERRFRIQLPWPFRGGGPQSEAINAGRAGSGSSGNGGGEPGGGSGAETRQEDLD